MTKPLLIQTKLNDDPNDHQAIYLYSTGEIIIRTQTAIDPEWGPSFFLDMHNCGMPDFRAALEALAKSASGRHSG